MKQLKLWFLVLAGAMVLLSQGCDECTKLPDPPIGNQTFTVEYVTSSGTNYLNSIYNKNNISVYADYDGGTRPNPDFTQIIPGYAEGKFGPFGYTERYIIPETGQANTVLLLGNTIRQDYYMDKDTFGTDKFTVEFLLAADECNTFWSLIKYYHNDVHLPEYDGQEQPNIKIVE